MQMRVDAAAVTVADGTTLLEACDAAGRYVPRLCFYPGLACCARAGVGGVECGLCVVRLQDGSVALACVTRAAADLEVTTQDPGLAAARLERLARILARHPHVCLACPDRDGCTRDQCTYGHPADARCCDQFGRCELGKMVAHLDSEGSLARGSVTVPRDAVQEGRIRREPGLCIGCGRCVMVCDTSPQAGRALEMVARSVDPAVGFVARPKRDTLRVSGCTFCGHCVMVCPAGALTAPGEDGARWLADRRAKSSLCTPVLPPEAWQAVDLAIMTAVPCEAGVFQLMDPEGQILRIGGVANLRQGLAEALAEPACVTVAFFKVELDPLYTQRESELLARYAHEHGHLPPGNDLAEDLYVDLL